MNKKRFKKVNAVKQAKVAREAEAANEAKSTKASSLRFPRLHRKIATIAILLASLFFF